MGIQQKVDECILTGWFCRKWFQKVVSKNSEVSAQKLLTCSVHFAVVKCECFLSYLSNIFCIIAFIQLLNTSQIIKPLDEMLICSQVTFIFVALLTIQSVKATAQYQNRKIVSIMSNDKITPSIFSYVILDEPNYCEQQWWNLIEFTHFKKQPSHL